MRPLNWLLVFLLAVSVINYPNPFNPLGGEISTFECTTDTDATAYLYIYDMGAHSMLRKSFDLQAGVNRTTWDGYNGYNKLAGNGIYLYQIIDTQMNILGRGKIWVINQ